MAAVEISCQQLLVDRMLEDRRHGRSVLHGARGGGIQLRRGRNSFNGPRSRAVSQAVLGGFFGSPDMNVGRRLTTRSAGTSAPPNGIRGTSHASASLRSSQQALSRDPQVADVADSVGTRGETPLGVGELRQRPLRPLQQGGVSNLVQRRHGTIRIMLVVSEREGACHPSLFDRCQERGPLSLRPSDPPGQRVSVERADVVHPIILRRRAHENFMTDVRAAGSSCAHRRRPPAPDSCPAPEETRRPSVG